MAAIGVFLPPYILVLVLAPFYRRFAQNLWVKAFVQGVTAAAAGAITGAAFILGKHAMVDIPAVVIAVVALGLLLTAKKLPEPLVILAAGGVGMAIRSW
jgi:chromate transporter